MNFLKKCFNRVIGWMAYPLAKSMDKMAQLFAPALVDLKSDRSVKWTWKAAGQVVMGFLLLILTSVALCVTFIGSIAGFTLLFALVLPSLMANVIAILGTLYIGYRVYEDTEPMRADEIAVDFELN
jgi:hypothetical protein